MNSKTAQIEGPDEPQIPKSQGNSRHGRNNMVWILHFTVFDKRIRRKKPEWESSVSPLMIVYFLTFE